MKCLLYSHHGLQQTNERKTKNNNNNRRSSNIEKPVFWAMCVASQSNDPKYSEIAAQNTLTELLTAIVSAMLGTRHVWRSHLLGQCTIHKARPAVCRFLLLQYMHGTTCTAHIHRQFVSHLLRCVRVDTKQCVATGSVCVCLEHAAAWIHPNTSQCNADGNAVDFVICASISPFAVSVTLTHSSHTQHTQHTQHTRALFDSRDVSVLCLCCVCVKANRIVAAAAKSFVCMCCVCARGGWMGFVNINKLGQLTCDFNTSHTPLSCSWKSPERRHQIKLKEWGPKATATTNRRKKNNKNTSNNIRDQNHFSHFFVVVVFACRLFWLWWEPCVEPCEIHTFFVIPIRRQYFSIVLFHSFATDTQSRAVIASQTALAAAAKQFCSDRVSASKWK